jgi:hypothetical protein
LARYLDDLVLKAKNYFDHRRARGAVGSQDGEFPVDHREALFALSLTNSSSVRSAGVVGTR